MKLTTPALVLARIGFDTDITAVNAAVESALHGATSALEGTMGINSFGEVEYADEFFVHSMLTYPQTRTQTLALSAGLIKSSPAPTVQVKPQSEFITLDWETVDTSHYSLNSETGRLVLQHRDFSGSVVKCSYTAGLAVDGSDAELYTGVPVWLKEAAITKAIIILDDTSPTTRHNDESDARRAIAGLNRTLDNILAGHVRYFPMALVPING
jgi:hypothetical protein